jgi:hypothetical protein
MRPVHLRSVALVVIASASSCKGASGAERAPDPAPIAQPAPKSNRAPPATSSSLPRQPPAGGPLLLATPAGAIPAARARRILHVGDSMVPLVGNYLRPMVQARGGTYDMVSVTSSSTREWGGPKRILQDAVFRYDPEVILISLGSNELFDPRPETRLQAVQQIISDTRGRPCLWIGPPAWKTDSGFLAMVRRNLEHCQYFDSTRLNLPRMPDGRHPDWTGGYRWASGVWKALGGTEAVPTGHKPTTSK